MPIHECIGRILDLLRREAVTLYEIIELGFRQFGFDAADQHGGEFIADLGYKHGNAECALGVQVACEEIGPVPKFARRFPDAVLGGIGDRT